MCTLNDGQKMVANTSPNKDLNTSSNVSSKNDSKTSQNKMINRYIGKNLRHIFTNKIYPNCIHKFVSYALLKYNSRFSICKNIKQKIISFTIKILGARPPPRG